MPEVAAFLQPAGRLSSEVSILAYIKPLTAAVLASGLLALIGPQRAHGSVPGLGETSAAPAADVAPAPHWEAEITQKELGDVVRGGLLRHRFMVKNSGNAPLRLGPVGIPCRCAEVTVAQEIGPGEEGPVDVEAGTVDMAGPVSVSFSVQTNEPDRPVIAFKLSALVKAAVKAKPGYARISYVLGEPVGGVKERIWADDFPELQVLEVKSPYPYVAVAFRELAAGERLEGAKGRQWEVEIGIRADAVVGPLLGAVEIVTNHPIDKLARIPLSGFVRPTLAVTPQVARLIEPVWRANGVVFEIDVRNFATESIELTKVLSKAPESIAVEIKRRVPGRRYAVVVSLPKGLPTGPFKGEVRVATSSSKVPEISIPIEAIVKE